MKMFKTIIVAGLLLYSCFVVAEQENARPNIIVVMGDDHAQWAMGAYGLEQIDTPNLDWLAERGVLFENAMSPAPVCSPARASFYTGKMPSQHGVHDFLSQTGSPKEDWLAGEVLLSQRLKKQGYRTALLGKWHATSDNKPPQPGFDRWLSYDEISAGWRNQYLHSGTVEFASDGKPYSYTGVQARFLTQEAIKFIDESKKKPFFVSLNFVEPHAPFDGLPERLVSKYRNVVNEIVRSGGSSALPDRGSISTVPDDHGEQLAQYLAAVSLIDDQMGHLLDALSGRGLLENTLVIYTSDHGLLVGQYGLYGKANATKPTNFYDETIRIPMIVYGPSDLMRMNQSRGEFVDLLDLHETILDFASAGKSSSAENKARPGKSMRPLLSGTRGADWRTVQFAERGNARMVTDGQWKLVRYYQRNGERAPEDKWYDLTHPLGERLAADAPRPTLRDSLIAKLEQFFKKFETPEHTGRDVWNQPPANARMRRDLQADSQDSD